MAAHLAKGGWSSLKLGIRPEFVHVSDEPFVDALAGEVTHVEDLGTYKILTLNLDGQRLKARLQEDETVPRGTAWIGFPSQWLMLYADDLLVEVVNNKAWWLVLPVFLLVAFSAILPMMTVVNYSVQDTFGNNEFFWAGAEWFSDTLSSERFWSSLQRNLLFSFIILAIEVPLGILIALNMPKKGLGVPVCLVLMALPLLIPWNVV
eukprot:gene13010-15900_t